METVERDMLRRAAANPDLVGLTPEDIVDSLDEMYYFVSIDGKFVQWNTTVTDVSGYTNGDLRQMDVTVLFTPSDQDLVKTQIGRTVTTQEPRTFEATVENQRGEEVPYEFSAKPVTDDQGACHGVIGIGRDISKRRKRELRLDKVLSHSPVYLFAVDSDGVLQLSRGKILEKLGLSEGDGVGRRLSDIYDEKAFISLVQQACQGETIQQTVELRDIALDVVCEPITVAGEVKRVVGVGYDVSELKRYESQIETQRDQLHLLNRVVRHDIRNNLQIIQAYLDLIAPELPGESNDHVEIIRENIESALGLTVTAKELSDVMLDSDTNGCKEIHLTSVLMDEVEHVESRFSAAQISFHEDLPIYHVDGHDLLDAVFRNILMNAVLHNDKDVPEITVSVAEHGDTVEVQVADNGPGIRDERKDQIFSKDEKGMQSAGSGIGLYLVQLIVERSEGDVWVTDNEPDGSIFHVTLPKAD